MNDSSIVRSYEDLYVYRKAYGLALDMHKFTLTLPKSERFALGDQMRRASRGICANIAEGFSRQRSSSPDFRRYLVMATGSSDEMKVWLSFCRDLGYMPKEQATGLKKDYVDVAKMLNGLQKKWK